MRSAIGWGHRVRASPSRGIYGGWRTTASLRAVHSSTAMATSTPRPVAACSICVCCLLVPRQPFSTKWARRRRTHGKPACWWWKWKKLGLHNAAVSSSGGTYVSCLCALMPVWGAWLLVVAAAACCGCCWDHGVCTLTFIVSPCLGGVQCHVEFEGMDHRTVRCQGGSWCGAPVHGNANRICTSAGVCRPCRCISSTGGCRRPRCTVRDKVARALCVQDRRVLRSCQGDCHREGTGKPCCVGNAMPTCATVTPTVCVCACVLVRWFLGGIWTSSISHRLRVVPIVVGAASRCATTHVRRPAACIDDDTLQPGSHPTWRAHQQGLLRHHWREG